MMMAMPEVKYLYPEVINTKIQTSIEKIGIKGNKGILKCNSCVRFLTLNNITPTACGIN
jgi:hypothetical protein